jgi:hypothetical protein
MRPLVSPRPLLVVSPSTDNWKGGNENGIHAQANCVVNKLPSTKSGKEKTVRARGEQETPRRKERKRRHKEEGCMHELRMQASRYCQPRVVNLRRA